MVKHLNSTVAKRGSVFYGLMTPNGAIWFRYQRAVLFMVQISKGCFNEVIIISLQQVIKRPLEDNIPVIC